MECKSHGSDLVTIHSEEEDKFVSKFIPGYVYVVNFWMRLRRGSGNRFRWVDGTTVFYHNWSKGEPNNSGDGNRCGEMEHAAFRWNSAPCSRRQAYVCKKRKCIYYRNISFITRTLNDSSEGKEKHINA